MFFAKIDRRQFHLEHAPRNDESKKRRPELSGVLDRVVQRFMARAYRKMASKPMQKIRGRHCEELEGDAQRLPESDEAIQS